jgi:hypothetical protein
VVRWEIDLREDIPGPDPGSIDEGHRGCPFSQLEQAIGQRRLAVIDAGDGRKVAEALLGDAAATVGCHACEHDRGERRP